MTTVLFTSAEMIWLAACVVFASLTAYLVGLNEFPCLRRRLVPNIGPGAILAISVVVHAGCAVVFAVVTSIGIAITIMSLAAFVWAGLSYLLFQRFAEPLEQPGVARRTPAVLPSISFGCFVSSLLSSVVFLGWYWAFMPVLVWVVIGFAATEHMIRRAMARGCDRGLAIFSINSAQGTRDFFNMNRYPFP
jgi:hypothetical protein